MPFALRAVQAQWPVRDQDTDGVRRAFYALCTHLDHQLRTVIGTLREERILDDTIILFTADHGDMLGDHGLWAKRLYYESSARVPMILVGARSGEPVRRDATDPRLVGLQDVMPTLLSLAGVPVPASVDGLSMVGATRRDRLYGEFGVAGDATRMITDDRYKLVYYPAGNHVQLFDLAEDPGEAVDLAAADSHAPVRRRLTSWLLDELYGSDADWVRDGELVGVPEPTTLPPLDRGLHGVRGHQWPPPPLDDDPGRVVGAPQQ
jgi:arylsulfatase A-like enzyme